MRSSDERDSPRHAFDTCDLNRDRDRLFRAREGCLVGLGLGVVGVAVIIMIVMEGLSNQFLIF